MKVLVSSDKAAASHLVFTLKIGRSRGFSREILGDKKTTWPGESTGFVLFKYFASMFTNRFHLNMIFLAIKVVKIVNKQIDSIRKTQI